jgi:hypothetical protein
VLVRTDDEIYRVDSVWLGPPRATFPWRARYVSYGVGLVVMIMIMFVQRRVGIGLDFFSVAWALVLTVAITRFLGQRIDYERPLGQVVTLFRHEVTGPRRRTTGTGGLVRSSHVRVGPAVRPPRSRARREADRPRERAGGAALWGRRAGSGTAIGAGATEHRRSRAVSGRPASPPERGRGSSTLEGRSRVTR